jgi:endonuclease/exonuclease/phosphatase family metal-dependent hydrolase
MTLTVMTYNIKNGGQPDRLDAIIRVVAAYRPDVLALQELAGFDRDRGRLMREVASAVGMSGYLAKSWFGQPVAILVRAPGTVTSARRVRGPFHHAAAEVTMATDRGPLTILGTHLCPYSGQRRLVEARTLARQVDPGRLMLLTGDLNTLDPWTDHRERLRALPDQHRSRHLQNGKLDTRAVAALADAGLVDLFRQVGEPGTQDYSVPTEHGDGTDFDARMRLDYVLGTGPVARLATACRIVSGGETESASDHYPMLAELDLTPLAAS